MTSPPMSPPQRHTDRDWLISLVSDRVGAWVKRRVRVGLAVQTLYTCTCLFTELASRKMRVVAHPGISSQDTCTTHRIAVLLGKAGPNSGLAIAIKHPLCFIATQPRAAAKLPPACACTREPVWPSGKALGW